MMSLISVSYRVQGVLCWEICQLVMNKKKYVLSFSSTPGQVTSEAQPKDLSLKFMCRRIHLNGDIWKLMSFLPLQKKLIFRISVLSHFQPKEPLCLSELWQIPGIKLCLCSLLTMETHNGKIFLWCTCTSAVDVWKTAGFSAEYNVNTFE